MLFSKIQTELGQATSITLSCPYISSPMQAFKTLGSANEHSLLLESAEIDSKDELKSLMLLDTAVVFECNGNEVIATAQSINGEAVLEFLETTFADEQTDSVQTKLTDGQLHFLFDNQLTDVDETERLKQVNAFEVLRSVINKIKHSDVDIYSLFLGGVFAYDMIGNFESLPEVSVGANTCPDYVFYLAETLVVIDHKSKTTELVGNVFSGDKVYQSCFEVGRRLEQLKNDITALPEESETINTNTTIDFSKVEVDISDAAFKKHVEQLKQNIVQGDIFQVVPSRSFSLPCSNSLTAYQHLKQDNPSPYMFYLKHPEFELFGASPESALKYDALTKKVEVYPIAGTRKRGFDNKGNIDHDLDSRIELELRNDNKEVSEHIMLVDLARNDVARISKPGTRYVKDFLKVDRYSYVMHLVSRVIGQLESNFDALHAYQACMNMGTLVGAPKIKAAELIRQVEQKRRGSYGGAVGYLNGRGDMDTCIVIRSAFVKNNQAIVQAGAGVVFDSIAESEVQETTNKAQAVIKAVLNANLAEQKKEHYYG